MKKFITILNVILAIILVVLSLYVFDIVDIPFFGNENNDEPIKLDTNGQIVEEIDDIDKVGRKKSYSELMDKADQYKKSGMYTQAIDYYTQANQKEPQAIEPLIQISEIHVIQRNFEQAKAISLEVLKIDPQNQTGKLILGRANVGLEDFATAKNIFDSMTSETAITYYYKGIMALYFGEHKNARTLLETAMTDPNDTNTAEKAQDFLAALDEWNSYQGGEITHLQVLLARSYVQAYEPYMAKDILWNVLKENRNYRDAWIILGYTYLQLQQFEDAIDALEEAKRQDPEKPETLLYLGLAYAGNNDTEKAIEVLELALENGYEPSIHVEQRLAELYFQTEDYEKANESFEEVISLNASDTEYFVRPIWVYIEKLEKTEAAVKLAEKAQLKNPDDAMSYNLLGWAQVANRDYINGKRNLERAIAMNEDLEAPYLNLGMMYESQESFERAKEFYKKAYETGNGSGIGNIAAQRYNTLLDRELGQSMMVNVFN
jgi:tetratricopeptide (TPR) repeat protein